MYRWGNGGGSHVLGILFLIVFLIAVIALVVLVARWARSGPTHTPPAPQPGPSDAALAAARMRYARGELSREDFLRISTDLQEHAIGSPTNP
jgi:uncharacterized membrane protein